ncbi:MAG: cysteine-rich KTR domain-containing protein [Lachnospiraceae bacterium]|nr:cysteine-rich KTR domain-containing protein [Lachnospiraceae bacterium]
MINTEWVICPICKNKTRNKIRQDTILKNYPLFCPKCKNETLIDIEDMKVNIVKE